MKRLWLEVVLVLTLIAIGTFIWFRPRPQQAAPLIPAGSPSPIAPSPNIAPPKPAIKYPVEANPNAAQLPSSEHVDDFIKGQLAELFAAKNVRTHFLLENFVRRVVATVDNLALSLAPPRMWPIQSMPGRFTVETNGAETSISARNEARYAAFVSLVEAVDSARAVALYHQLYPLFQRSYEDLGYPGKYFNDRLVAVIDLLIRTPEPSGPLQVELPEFHGPLKPTHPWVLYRFSDPALEGLSSGQKMLLRMGRRNEERLKVKLAELRTLIVGQKVNR